MKRIAAFLALCAAAAAVGAVAVAGPPPPKGVVSVSFPGDAGMSFKPGPNLAAVQANCLTCHSSAYVSTQPAFSKAQWTAEVNKMRAVYGAPIPEDQVAPIVDYLTTQYGKP